MPRIFLAILSVFLLMAAAASAQQSDSQRLQTERIIFEHDATTKKVARFLAQRADEHVRHLEQRLGVQAGEPMVVRLASSEDEFGEANPGNIPDWAAGTAYPKQSLIVLRTHSGTSDTAALERRLVHEITHVLVQRAAGDSDHVPRWLTEGVAQTESGQSLLERSRSIVPATISGDLLTIRDLTQGWPADGSRARLAYAQSIALITWLEREHGPQVIPDILAALKQGNKLDPALVLVVGRNLASLEKAYRSRLTWVHTWLPVVGSSGTVWVLTTVLFLYAAWRKRKERRLGMQRLEAEEAAWAAQQEAWAAQQEAWAAVGEDS